MLPRELASLRGDIERLLPDTVDILTVTRTLTGTGGFTEAWGTASTVACRKDHKSGLREVTGGALQAYDKDVFTLPYGTAVTVSNRLQWNSTTYHVTAISDGSWKACIRVEVEKV